MFNPIFVHNRKLLKYFSNLFDDDAPLRQKLSDDNKNYFSIASNAHPALDFCSRSGPWYDPWGRNLQGFAHLAIPKLTDQKLSYAEICDLVASDIVRIVNNSDRKLLVAYSGGVDSTLLLVSLLKNDVPKEKLLILLNDSSIDENPLFYQNYIYDKLNCEDIVKFIQRDKDYRDYYRVTGDFGNKVGCDGKNYTFHDQYNISNKTSYQNWKMLLVGMHIKNVTQESLEWLISKIDETIKHAPCLIETTNDYLWWIHFNFKWSDGYYRRAFSMDSYGLVANKDPSLIHKHFSGELEFYSRDEFQIWSMQHTGQSSEKFPDDNKIYAPSAKQYILEFNGDLDYYRNKKKVASTPSINLRPDSPVLIDTNHQSHFGACDQEIRRYIIKTWIDK